MIKHNDIPAAINSLLSEEVDVCKRYVKGQDVWSDIDCKYMFKIKEMMNAWLKGEDYDDESDEKSYEVSLYFHTNITIKVKAKNRKEALEKAYSIAEEKESIDILVDGLIEDDSPDIVQIDGKEDD